MWHIPVSVMRKEIDDLPKCKAVNFTAENLLICGVCGYKLHTLRL
ncbi:hypothetical protein [Congzhengia minquanensis]|nr:hypothetical protein [Congzhengia minquanensis]